MVDREAPSDLELRFTGLKSEIVQQMAVTHAEALQQYAGVVIRIVTNEWDDGVSSLMLDNKGVWSGKTMMTGYDIGENPDLNQLLEEYAGIKEGFMQLCLTMLRKPTQDEINIFRKTEKDYFKV